MKKYLKLACLLAATTLGGILSAAGLWGQKTTTPRTASPRISVSTNAAAQVAVSTNALRTTAVQSAAIDRNGEYTDKDNLCRYIVSYGTLPKNFITKNEARRLGWSGGPLEPYAPGKSIGGDRYGNYERTLPNGRYKECDVDTRGKPRGAKRIVFSDDKRVYYSDDHYRTFKRLH